jgi:prevent-host-death family protein
MANRTVNMHDAMTNLSKLVDEVEAGGSIILARAGKPVARIVPVERTPPRIKFGLMKGKIQILAGFDDPIPFDRYGLA